MTKFEEKTVASDFVFNGRVFSVKLDKITLPDGREDIREVILHDGGAGIVPIDKDGNIFLVRQWRYPFNTEMLEIPAGKLSKGENAMDCALRELREETGLIAGSIELIGCAYATPAYCSEVLTVYLARDLLPARQELDDGEFLEVIKMPFQQAFDMVMRDEIKDAKTQIGILKAFFWLRNSEKMI